MIVWGISAQSHDASLAVVKNGEILFASHSERYSRKKNDADLHEKLLSDALCSGEPDCIFWYESPWIKYTRQIVIGKPGIAKLFPEKYVRIFHNKKTRFITSTHHRSHAATGFFTSGLSNAAVVVVDSVGEWETSSIWTGNEGKLKKCYSQHYPHSLGLWYSAMTHRCGLQPNQDEYILMGMAAFGNPDRFYEIIKNDFFKRTGANFRLRHNLFWGCRWWKSDELKGAQDFYDVAAATQRIFEEIMLDICSYAAKLTNCRNLVLAGGCALNCVANSLVVKQGWEKCWIFPNPGDAGSAVGAIAGNLCKPVDWVSPFLGHEIEGKYPVKRVLNSLLQSKIAGVASGRAEFGPRALGNRSFLADPRGKSIKDLVNNYKKREPFRPFAPAVLEEYADRCFEMPVKSSPYMQFVAKCRNPELYPAIVHVDGTSRVQTVGKKSDSGFRLLLEEWYKETGCPMLLNTSLNIKNQPLVNTEADAKEWSRINKVPVWCRE